MLVSVTSPVICVSPFKVITGAVVSVITLTVLVTSEAALPASSLTL